MGTVFGFVASDLKSKIDLLEELRQKHQDDNFITFSSMIEFEKTSGLLNKNDYVSGSRTLLRLHRGLGWLCNSFVSGYYYNTFTNSMMFSIFS